MASPKEGSGITTRGKETFLIKRIKITANLEVSRPNKSRTFHLALNKFLWRRRRFNRNLPIYGKGKGSNPFLCIEKSQQRPKRYGLIFVVLGSNSSMMTYTSCYSYMDVSIMTKSARIKSEGDGLSDDVCGNDCRQVSIQSLCYSWEHNVLELWTGRPRPLEKLEFLPEPEPDPSPNFTLNGSWACIRPPEPARIA
ncbi:hypothetical protein L484_017425 [Morus notabilis]|uniref:Uncharacterized protein n=1 Tax=Morus notabilis TaxID=981085 RepID=W9QVS5_9ROSA|nr:hypothetical protein L484_017425 [Morus notabilis]